APAEPGPPGAQRDRPAERPGAGGGGDDGRHLGQGAEAGRGRVMSPARLRYYASSIPTLLRGVANWPATAAAPARGPPRAPVAVELREGGRFRIGSALDLWILKEVCLDREYERYGPAVRNGWTVVDVGAGVGEFCIQVARRHPDCRVYAFEPGAEAFALL